MIYVILGLQIVTLIVCFATWCAYRRVLKRQDEQQKQIDRVYPVAQAA